MAAATRAMTHRLALPPPKSESSKLVAEMAAATRKSTTWMAPPTPVLKTIALPPDATGTPCLCR